MIPVKIAGLVPDTNVIIKNILNEANSKNSPSLILIDITVQEDVLNTQISSKFIGKEVEIFCMNEHFIYEPYVYEVEELGIFHALKFQFDRNYAGFSNPSINLNEHYVRAQGIINRAYRKARYKRRILKPTYWLVYVLFPLGGYSLGGGYGLFFGLIADFFIARKIEPYALGRKDLREWKFWKL